MTPRPISVAAPARWRGVAGRTVYFGHQSVGRDLISGIESINAAERIGLRVIETDDPKSLAGPTFVHFLAGKNRDYASKNAALLRLLNARKQADRAIVLLKYCYVDLGVDLSPDVVFSAYCEMVETIQCDHPDVTTVHTTMPLTAVESGLRAGLRRAMGQPTLRDASIARHRYNELLRARFAGKQPVFDLARVEATTTDGTVARFNSPEGAIPIMASENTYDGGHLSPRCRLAAAAALLETLTDAIEGTDAVTR